MIRFIALLLFLMIHAHAQDTLSYSGRLVNPNGTPVTGTPPATFELVYTNNTNITLCSKTQVLSLTDGVFQADITFVAGTDCPGKSLAQVLYEAPATHSVAVKVTVDGNTYSHQALHTVPSAIMADMAKTLAPPAVGTPAGHVLKWDGTQWAAAPSGGSGTLTTLTAGTGIVVTPAGADSFEVALQNAGVGNTQLANGAVTNVKINAAALIDRSKIAAGTPGHIVINDGLGVMSSVSAVPIEMGGTAAATVGNALTNLGITVGVAPGNVLSAGALPVCGAAQRLQWVSVPAFGWVCGADVDSTGDATKLPLAGGTMTGDLDMNGNKVTNLGATSAATDGATKSHVDGLVQWTLAGGHITRATGYVGIGTATPLAILDLTSTTSALLLPRMTTVERNAIVAVPVGTQIYNINTNEINYHNGTIWKELGTFGTGLTSITAGTGLSGGVITTTGTIGIAAGGVTATELAASAVTNAHVPAGADIARTKIAAGTLGHVLINDGTGVMISAATITHTQGGTGLSALTANRFYVSNTAGNALEVLPCLPTQFVGFDVIGRPVCNTLPVAASGVAGIVSITTQTMSGNKTFEEKAVASEGVQFGASAAVCDATSEGVFRFNSTTNRIEYCNATTWGPLSGGSYSILSISLPSLQVISSGPVTFMVTYNPSTDPATISLVAGNVLLSGSDVSGCSVTGVSGSGYTRTVTVNGCTGNGTVSIYIAAGTANSTTGDPAPSAGPSVTFTVNSTTNCANSPAPGTVCTGGAIYVGSYGSDGYMTTPSGCGEIPAGQIVGTGTNAYPNADFTPTCSGADTLTKTWNDGTANWYDIPTMTNYIATGGVGFGLTNIDDTYGSVNTTNLVAISAAGQGGKHAAAQYCDKLSYAGYSDWILPNRWELNLFWKNVGSHPSISTDGTWYWSSTEHIVNYGWLQKFSDGNQNVVTKDNAHKVRCMRRFLVDSCAGSPIPGTVCKGGAIFAGTVARTGHRYMTTPGGCADIPATQKIGTGTNSYPRTDFTVTCSGTDTLTKTWNDGSVITNVVPGLVVVGGTIGVGNGAINTDTQTGDVNTAALVAMVPPAVGGFHASARYCDSLVYGGYTDWFLPNREELNLFWDNKVYMTGLAADTYYRSSTTNGFGWVQQFGPTFLGYQSYGNNDNALVFRCMRRY